MRIDYPSRLVRILTDGERATSGLLTLLCVHFELVDKHHGNLAQTPAWHLVHAAGHGTSLSTDEWSASVSNSQGLDLPGDARTAHDRLMKILCSDDPDLATPVIGATLAALWYGPDPVVAGRLRHAVQSLSRHLGGRVALDGKPEDVAERIWGDAAPGQPIGDDLLPDELPTVDQGPGKELGCCVAGIDTLSKHVTFRCEPASGVALSELRSTFVLHFTADALIQARRVNPAAGAQLRSRLHTITYPAGGPVLELGSWVREENVNLPNVEIDGQVFQRWLELGGRDEKFDDARYIQGLADLACVLAGHAI